MPNFRFLVYVKWVFTRYSLSLPQNEPLKSPHRLGLISSVTGCVSISAFVSLVSILIGITSSAIGLKICIITAGIKKYKSVIKKKKKKHDKILSAAKFKLKSVEVLISKALID